MFVDSKILLSKDHAPKGKEPFHVKIKVSICTNFGVGCLKKKTTTEGRCTIQRDTVYIDKLDSVALFPCGSSKPKVVADTDACSTSGVGAAIQQIIDIVSLYRFVLFDFSVGCFAFVLALFCTNSTLQLISGLHWSHMCTILSCSSG